MNKRSMAERRTSWVGAAVMASLLLAACAKRDAPEATASAPQKLPSKYDSGKAAPTAGPADMIPPVATATATAALPGAPKAQEGGSGTRSNGLGGGLSGLGDGQGFGKGSGAPSPAAEKARDPGSSAGAKRKLVALEANPFESDGKPSTPKANAPATPPVVGAAPRVDPVPVAKTAETAINPNGRFATTYRPGNGHLNAFESAVSRGVIPETERELVSDVGARYGADVPAPTAKTMVVSADLERGKLPPSGGAFHTRLTVRSTAKAPAERPRLSVHLVLDVSGSMAGEAIINARKAAAAMVDKLAATDDFSLVTFSSDAKVEIPDGPVGPRRDQIKKTIEGIKEGGGTNIGAGLQLGYEQARTKSIHPDAVKVVLLLSDGHVNAGILNPNQLSKLALDAFQDGVQTSSFGLGSDYDGPLMSAIASDGAGGYYYLRDSEQIAPALVAELDKRLDPVATAVEVRVRLKKGVELLKVYGSQRLTEAEAARVRAQEVAIDTQEQKKTGIKSDRQSDQEGGMRFFMPTFARDEGHALLLKLRAPEGVGSKPLALIELKYKDRIGKKNVSEEFAVNAEYAGSDADSFASVNASVNRTAQGFAAGEALASAASLINRNDRDGAAALLAERAGILREAAASLGEPLFLKDAERLERLRGHAQQQTGMGDPLVLAMLLETASHVHLR